MIYLLCQLASANAVISTNAGQMYIYTGSDPNSDGIIPANTSKPAIAYKLDGTGAIYGWNTTLQIWN